LGGDVFFHLFTFLRINPKSCGELRNRLGFPIRAIAAGRAF
jgi:hypothetical protein